MEGVAGSASKVYVTRDYYDGPRTGIADYAGEPHYFECEWDDLAHNYASTYLLTPVSTEVLALAEEADAIFVAWDQRRRRGEVSTDTHPGFGGMDARYDEVTRRLRRTLYTRPALARRARASFERGQEVEWHDVLADDAQHDRVAAKVRNEAQKLAGMSNFHGITPDNVSEFLVDPVQVPVDQDDAESMDPEVMWLFLQERSNAEEGLVGVYACRSEMWGVAEYAGDGLWVLVVSGETLREALEGM